MKNKITALALLTAGALSLAATPARANDNGLAIFGGVLGGLIVASAINDSHHDTYSSYAPAYVGYDSRPGYRDDGCWQDVAVQVYVPGCWVEERGYRGHVARRFVRAHYESRTNRTWVANNNHRGYDNHDNRDNRYNRNSQNDRSDRRGNDSHNRSHR